MSEEMKKDIRETVDILKSLDPQSLMLVQAGAQMLKARKDMDEKEANLNAARETRISG